MAAWNELSSDLVDEIHDLHREACAVCERLVVPGHATSSFNQTLYGYVHRVFAYVDLLSSYWRGNDGSQSTRMVDFMESYLGPDRRAHGLAVQIWRHKLVHTGRPRDLSDPSTGAVVRYMIQWQVNSMPPHQPHYTVTSGGILNIACLALIEDLERGVRAYLADIAASHSLQANAAAFAAELSRNDLRIL